MVDVTITHNVGDVAAAIERRGSAAVAAVDRALGRGAREVARDAQREAPKFRSQIATSAQTEHTAPLVHTVRFGARHAAYVERGTGAGGRPTLAEMLDWLRLKGITPRIPGMSQRSLAALIRKRIAQRGIKAQPFAQPALERNIPAIAQRVRAAVASSLQEATR